MIPLTYTQSIEQEGILRRIEMLRGQLLTLVIPPSRERAIRWKNNTQTVASAYILANVPSTYDQVSHALTLRKPTLPIRGYHDYWEAMILVQESWTGSSAFKDVDSYITLFQTLREYKHIQKTAWNSLIETLSIGIDYIQSDNEHPLVQSAILSAIVLTSNLELTEAYLFGSLVAHALLVTHGYNCSDRVSPITGWTREKESIKKGFLSIERTGNLNHWILLISDNLQKKLEESIKLLSIPTDIHTDNTLEQYKHLTMREKSILAVLEQPGIRINNTAIQRRFGVSQVTASRDLSHLTSLGLLSPSGKSRSTSYTKIA